MPSALRSRSVAGKGVITHNVVRILALDEHVGFADGPSLVVPILTEQLGMGFAVELADIVFAHRKHTASSASRIINGLDHMTASQILFRGQQQIHHQLDHLPRGEVLPGPPR